MEINTTVDAYGKRWNLTITKMPPGNENIINKSEIEDFANLFAEF